MRHRRVAGALLGVLSMQVGALAGELLHNGIELPASWPPRVHRFVMPMSVPYLAAPPPVIPIDVGRQLFVDDFLVESTTLKRTFHQAEYHPASPVISPDPRTNAAEGPQIKGPVAMPFSDGVWFDPQDNLFKAWYMGDAGATTRYAVSRDGIRWEKPGLDVVQGTNVVLKHAPARDSSVVWLDQNDRDPKARFKMFCTILAGKNAPAHGLAPPLSKADPCILAYYTSPDGIHWSKPVVKGFAEDRSTVFYNPFRKVWVFSLKMHASPHYMLPVAVAAAWAGIYEANPGRTRFYYEQADLNAALRLEPKNVYFWAGADGLDPRHPVAKYTCPPQLYNLDGVAYESLLLGLFTIWQGPENNVYKRDRIQKRNEVLLGFSRDGFHWHRPDRKPFAGVNETPGAWNWGNVQSAGGGCLVVGDKLYFYVSGRAVPTDPKWKGACTTGLAVLRRDGFASMDAAGKEGTLTTRAVKFRGKHLFANLAAPEGELRVEVLDLQGEPIEPFTRRNCQPAKGDKTLLPLRWTGAADLSALAGKPVKFRFHLTRGSLYAFWTSPAANGASHGYVAAGGPGFTGPIDTVGIGSPETR